MAAARHLGDLTFSFPFNILRYLVALMTTKTDFAYSNMPGPRSGFNFGGTKLTKLVAVGPMLGYSCNAIVFLSLTDTGRIGFSTNSGFIEFPDEFMDILNHKVKLFIGSPVTNSKSIQK